MAIAGIYTITSPTGRIYIGQSWDIETRWSLYRGFRCKQQPKLYSSLKKYGPQQHRFDVIHALTGFEITQVNLDNYERVYIELYKAHDYPLMNLRSGGSGGGKHSEETRDKMRKLNNRTVYQFSITGEFIKKWDSALQAARSLNITVGAICKCRRGAAKYYTAGGYVWSTTEEFPGLKKCIRRRKPILQFTKDDILVKEWPSITEAVRHYNNTHISKCCLGKRKTASGFKWVIK